MNKELVEILVEKANYNLWANQKICAVISSLSHEKLLQKVESSFEGVFPTLFHIWNAENIWLERLKGISLHSWPSRNINEENNIEKFLETSKLFLEFLVINQSNTQFPFKEITYSNLKGDPMKNSVYEIAFHCLNHSTYHRGQLITILRQLGAIDLPGTDFIAYLREFKT